MDDVCKCIQFQTLSCSSLCKEMLSLLTPVGCTETGLPEKVEFTELLSLAVSPLSKGQNFYNCMLMWTLCLCKYHESSCPCLLTCIIIKSLLTG
ncbi:hypothetical protein Z043_116692, partial [Scleropages formosus]